MENGLQVTSKKFKELEEIYSLEFINGDEKLLIIGKGSEVKGLEVEGSENQNDELRVIIWDLYRSGEVEIVVDLPMRRDGLDRTSGNVLYVDEKGNVESVLKMVES